MQIVIGSCHRDFRAHNATSRIDNFRLISVEPAITQDQQVGFEQVFVGGNHRMHTGRTRFFLALEKQLDVDGQLAIDGKDRLQRLQVEKTPDLSSTAPRAYRLPSRSVGSKGGVTQRSSGSTGCTS